MQIRRATPEDAAAVAAVHVRGWQWGYRGLLPQPFLDAMSIADRARIWVDHLQPEFARHTFVAESDARLLGFVTCGPMDDCGMIYALYLEEDVAGTGVGRALLSHGVSSLAGRGFREAVLWVLDSNQRARRFYERAGWQPDGTEREEVKSDHVRRELRYRRAL